MAGMLKLSDQEFKTTMINMLRAPMGKTDSIQEQIGHLSRNKEIRNKKETLQIKTL